MRYIFAKDADTDIDSIEAYLGELPQAPATRLGEDIYRTIELLAVQPLLGRVDAELSELAGENIYRYPRGAYVFFYQLHTSHVSFLGVLHGRRNVDAVMRQRLT